MNVGCGKMQLAALDCPSPKTLYSHKHFLHKPSYSQFCPKFRCHGNGVGRGKMHLSAFGCPSSITLYMRKNLAKISYASHVIANFVPNFVAMATVVGRGKMQLAAFNNPSPKTPL